MYICKYFYSEVTNTFTIWLIETGITPKLNVTFYPNKAILIKILLKNIHNLS